MTAPARRREWLFGDDSPPPKKVEKKHDAKHEERKEEKREARKFAEKGKFKLAREQYPQLFIFPSLSPARYKQLNRIGEDLFVR